MSSPPPKAKFAPRSPRPSSAFTDAERRAFALAEEAHGLAVGIVDAAIAEVAFEGEEDPKVYGLALLCRSISNFRGALTMARDDQAVESKTLIRSCVENLFLINQLLKHGAVYVKTMRSHEAAGRISLGESGLKHLVVAESPLGKTIRGRIKRERLNSPKKLVVSDTAKGEIERLYLTSPNWVATRVRLTGADRRQPSRVASFGCSKTTFFDASSETHRAWSVSSIALVETSGGSLSLRALAAKPPPKACQHRPAPQYGRPRPSAGQGEAGGVGLPSAGERAAIGPAFSFVGFATPLSHCVAIDSAVL
jgi:hypothetical protein